MHEVSISPVLMHTIDLDMPPAPTSTAGSVAEVSTAAFIARVPGVTAVRNATVTAVKATHAGIAGAPSVLLPATFAPVATSSAQVMAPVVTAAQTVTAVRATATGSASAPVATVAGDAIVAAVRANSSVSASIPAVAGSTSVTVTAVKATQGGSAIAPAVGLSATVNAVVARTNVIVPEAALPPTVVAEIVVTGGGPGTGNYIAIPPVVNGAAGGAGAVPTFGSVGTHEHSAGTALPLPVPSGMANNEIALAIIYVESTLAPTVIPSGFVQAPDSPVIVTGTQPYYLRAYYKRATGSDSGTYDFTMADTSFRQGIVMRVSGCVTSGSPFDVTASAVKTTTVDGNVPAVSDTTTGANRLLTWIGSNFNPGTYSTVTGFTERFEDGANSCFGIQTKDHLTAGSTGSLTSVCSATGSSAAWLGALLPTITTPSPAFASVGSQTGLAGNVATIPVPAGVAGLASECILAFIWHTPGTITWTVPTGFTEAPGSPITVTGVEAHTLRVYWKRPTGADAGTYDFASSPGLTGIKAYAARFTGCAVTGTPITGTGFSDPDASNNTSPSASVSAGASTLAVWVVNGNGGSTDFTGGFTERADDTTVAVATLPIASAGTVGPLVATCPGGPTRSTVWLGTILPA